MRSLISINIFNSKLMNITRENIDELNSVITLTIDKEDYSEKVAEVLRDYRKKAQMPGFRPGKVPEGLIKKMYGTAVLVDEVNKLISEKLSEYLSENKLNILGEPLPRENQDPIDFDTQDSFQFQFDIALSPEIDVKLSKRDKVNYYTIEVTDDVLDGHIKSMTSRFGKNEKVELISEKSLVKGDFVQVDKKGNEVEGGIKAEDSIMSLNIVKDEAEKKKMLGKKLGEDIVFDVKKAFPNDTEVSYILKISKEEAADVKGSFKFTVKEVTEFIDPELNQDLFDKLFGEGAVKSEEEMKERVKVDLEKAFAIESEYKFSIDAREKLVAKHEVTLPEEFLKRWLKATNRGDERLSDEQIDAEMPRFFEDLKWQLIKNAIIKANDIKVEENDIREEAKKSARMQFMQYGLTALPQEYIDNYANDLLKNEDQVRRIAEAAMDEKVMAYIKEAVKVEEKAVSREEFNKLFTNN